MKIGFFLEKNLKISSRMGQLILRDNSLEKKLLKNHFGDMIYTLRG